MLSMRFYNAAIAGIDLDVELPADRRMTQQANRLGLSLFAVYLVLYGGFVLLAAFSPQWMEVTPLAGVNLAIWYGFGLIVAALVLALVYGWANRPRNHRNQSNGDATGSKL
jgi:uncharacterized membrane protein (DUF485 family)